MKLDLATIKKRLYTRSVLAISVESGRILVDVLRSEESRTRVTKSFELSMGAEAVTSDAERVGQAIVERLQAEGIRERKSVVCIPASWALTTGTEVPEMPAEDLRGYFELRAEREFPISVSELKLAHCAYALPEGTRRATVAGVPSKRVAAVERMLATAGIQLMSLSLGLDGCVPRDSSPTAIHFVANGNHVDVVVGTGGGIALLRSLPSPRDSSTVDVNGISREVRITLGRLPQGLRNQVREARFGGSPKTAKVLFSGLSGDLGRLGINPTLESAEGDSGHAGAAIEAAEHYLRDEPVIFELLPRVQNRWLTMAQRFDSKQHRLFAIIGAAVLLLPILTFIVRSRIESSLENEWMRMRRQVTELESLQQKIRQFRPWFETSPQALKLMEEIVGAFPEQGDVWAKSVEVGEHGKVTCTGFARSQSALSAMLDRLRERKNFSGVQIQNVRGANPIQFTIGFNSEASDVK
jgi:Tfp pilus assembly protein PilN